MAFTTGWNVPTNEGDFAFEHELQGPAAADEPLRLRHPHYMLQVNYDRWLNITTARLLVMTLPREGWKRLDESVCEFDDAAEAVSRLRKHRHLARAYARAS